MVPNTSGVRTTNDEECLLPSHDNAERSTAGARPGRAARLGVLIALAALSGVVFAIARGLDTPQAMPAPAEPDSDQTGRL